tara:strand:- start:2237 stop:2449 length:213 start_codon:yes stop_codon:yes gene_type:complete
MAMDDRSESDRAGSSSKSFVRSFHEHSALVLIAANDKWAEQDGAAHDESWRDCSGEQAACTPAHHRAAWR